MTIIKSKSKNLTCCLLGARSYTGCLCITASQLHRPIEKRGKQVIQAPWFTYPAAGTPSCLWCPRWQASWWQEVPPWRLIKLKNLTDWIQGPQSSTGYTWRRITLNISKDRGTRSACVLGLDLKIHWSIQYFLTNCYRLVSETNDTEIHKGDLIMELQHYLLVSRSETSKCFLFNLKEVIKSLTLGLNVFLIKWSQRYLTPKAFWLR